MRAGMVVLSIALALVAGAVLLGCWTTESVIRLGTWGVLVLVSRVCLHIADESAEVKP